MKNIKKVRFGNAPRTELHDALSLTSCEVSFNTLPPDGRSRLVHYHRTNEEVFIITAGSGQLYVDGDTVGIAMGDCFMLEPARHRCMKAGPDGLSYISIQAREGSLESWNGTDAVVPEGEIPSWK